ncbi:2OG-Fe(II) oxygenase [Paraburkholderia aspalathi]|uniref:2OG-Fe(II) oxygenase n=1 Tax=Paraburkholderia aspalathi TaxID=1324617 RepID=UPI0038BDD764
MNYPVIKKKFLDPVICAEYVDFLKLTTMWESCIDKTWNHRFINLTSMHDALREQILSIRVSIKNVIFEEFKKDQLFCDIFQFVRWREGDVLLPHADSQNPDGSYHPYHYREYASLLYLNDDYEGGNIYFPKENFFPQVQPGDLVLFPGTLDYLHGVTKVTIGTRYTIAGFYTSDRTYHDNFRI